MTDPIVDNALLRAWLAEALAARQVRVKTAERLTGGAIQENWALDIEVDGVCGRLVLRRDAPATVASSRSRRDEFALISAAWDAGVTVPRPEGFCDDQSVLGGAFAVMACVAGEGYGPRVVKDPGLGGDRAALGRTLGCQLARIHAIPPTAEMAAILGPPPEDAGLSEIERLRGWLDAIGAIRPGLEWGLRWAEKCRPAACAPVLTHGDYRTGNYLVDENGLTAILDWEFAGWSDPMADLGWFCAQCWRFSRPDLEGGGVCMRADFYAGYEAERGRPVDAARVKWWELMAHIRWAVIALQQGHRHASFQERSLHLALTGRIADGLEFELLKTAVPAGTTP